MSHAARPYPAIGPDDVVDCTFEPRVEGLIRLSDGRSLAYAEWGKPDGRPIFLLHGMPGSRLFCPDEAVTATAAVRLITVDRPGYGGSDPQPGRRIVDGADDVGELASALRIDRFAVVGWSSGGPYALACAARMPARTAAVAVVAGDAPTDRIPELLEEIPPHIRDRIARLRRGDPSAIDELEARLAPFAEDPDQIFAGPPDPADPDGALRARHAVGAALAAMMREGFRQGIAGFRDDWVAAFLPWGFDLETIVRPVDIWWGDADPMASRAHAEALAAGVVGTTLTIVPGAGHLLAATAWPAILAPLVSAVVEPSEGVRPGG